MSKVQVNYKSGRSVVFTCDDFRVTSTGSEFRAYKGTAMKPRPLFFGMDDVESVWELYE